MPRRLAEGSLFVLLRPGLNPGAVQMSAGAVSHKWAAGARFVRPLAKSAFGRQSELAARKTLASEQNDMQSFECRLVRYWSKEINGTLTRGRKNYFF